MKHAALVVLVACSDPMPAEPPCPTRLVSDFVHRSGLVRSGRDLAGITWTVQIGASPAVEIHGAIVLPDGTTSPDISIDARDTIGTPGKTTMLWAGRFTMSPLGPLTATLQRGGEITRFDLAAHMLAHSVVFDGTSYQIFWIDNTSKLFHRSLSEAGVLGPEHSITFSGASTLAAASDGAGQTFLRLVEDGFLVDTTTGAMQRIYDAAPNGVELLGAAFYFDGEYHMIDERMDAALISVSPTGATRTRDWPDAVDGVVTVLPSGDRMLVQTFTEVHEVDAALAITRTFSNSLDQLGVIGDRILRFERTEIDEESLEPGRLAIATDAWRRELAVDSPVHEDSLCPPDVMP